MKPMNTSSGGDDSDTRDAELVIARKIQSAMIPRNLPVLEGLQLDSLYSPVVL
jgi:serine phosphatase RsbU (regulator of sigma subunit)